MKRNSRGIFIFLIVGILILTVAYLYRYAIDSPYYISASDAKRMIENKQFDVILDVRTDLERESLGFYPGSIHIQSADLAKRMPVQFPNKNVRILSYCNTGQRSRIATEKLHELGYRNALYIATTYGTLL